MKLIYIAGPFRAESYWGQEQNIRRAEELALEVWRAGMVAFCPHLNTAHFQGALPDNTWMDGDLEILLRCDALLLVDGWEKSDGACLEHDTALMEHMPVFHTLKGLKQWNSEQQLKKLES